MTPLTNYEHLSDRELLLLTTQTVDRLDATLTGENGLTKRIERLEVWPEVIKSIFRIAGTVGGAVALVAALFEIVNYTHGGR